jgi:hypothetical protein
MTIALYPGAFKPPHKGHFDVVQKLLERPDIDEVIILVSSKPRKDFTVEESVKVWELYKQKLNNDKLKIELSTDLGPVKDVYNIVKDTKNNYVLAFGKGEIGKYEKIIANPEEYSNVEIFDAGTVEGIDASNLRPLILKKDKAKIKEFLPSGIDLEAFLDIFKNKTMQEIFSKEWWMETLQLHESPPLEFEDDDYENYVNQNRDKVEQAAAVFNLPIDDMVYAFISGGEVVLSDDVWSKLENSKSYRIKSLDEAIQYALKLGINPKPYIDQIKSGKDLPLPMVLCYGQNKYYLVGGEVILSLYRALGSIPTVLQATLNLQTKQLHQPTSLGEGKSKTYSLIEEFMKFAVKELGLNQLPSGITISYDTDKAKDNRSMGYFSPGDGKVWLYVKDRTPADYLRTLAHELVHRKQAEDGRLDINSGKTGSEIENEANAEAGVLLRKFGELNNTIYEK